MATYKAWVPNVSGILSFSNIKGGKIPSRAVKPRTFNHLSNETRGCIYSLQQRNLSDTPHALFQTDGLFLYLLVAKIEHVWTEKEALAGSIYTYPKIEATKEDRKFLECFKKKDVEDYAIAGLVKRWDINPVIAKIDFHMTRDGFIKLEYKSPIPMDDDTESSVIFEAYSFIKDLVHTHKFHKHDDDAIVVPYRVANIRDTKWIDRTLRNLHKSIISTYRNAYHQQDIINAMGKLSYLDSFQQSVRSRYTTLKKIRFLQVETLKSSLEYKLAARIEEETTHKTALQTVLTLLLSFFALIIAMSQLLQLPCIEGLTYDSSCRTGTSDIKFIIGPNSIDIVEFILKHWYGFAIGLPISIGILTIWSFWADVRRWLNNNIGHGFFGNHLRMVLALSAAQYGRGLAIIWVLFFSIIFIFLFFVAIGVVHLKITGVS